MKHIPYCDIAQSISIIPYADIIRLDNRHTMPNTPPAMQQTIGYKTLTQEELKS